MEAETPFLSLVIPVYNESMALPALFKELDSRKEGLWKTWGGVEIVLVNDSSKDNSWELISEKCDADPDYLGVDLSRNFGQQLAMTAGLEIARGEVIVTLDADLQDPPDLIAEMVASYKKGYDVVHATRRKRGKENLLKKITAGGFYFLIEKISDVTLLRDTGDFRLLSRRAVTQLALMKERHRFLRGLVPWIGFPQVQVFYDRADRSAGETHYPLRKMLLLAFDGIASTSTAPLRLGYLVSLGLFSVFIGYVIYVLYQFFWLDVALVPGWTSLMCAITIFGSIQLLLLGVFGEYLGRIYEQSKERPLYIIQDVKRQRG